MGKKKSRTNRCDVLVTLVRTGGTVLVVLISVTLGDGVDVTAVLEVLAAGR